MAPPKWLPILLALAGCATVPEGEPPVPNPLRAELPGVTRGVAYGDGLQRRLDLFVPAGEKPMPLVVFVHGGAWQGGSRSEYDRIAMKLMGEGLAAASVDYRLSPAVRHPAHAEDVARALLWLGTHAAKYGYDSKRLFVVGHSAGGHIAATLATDPKRLGSAKVAGFVGLEGIYDVPNLAKRFPTYPGWFLDHAFGPRTLWAAASPTRAKAVASTPWLLVHSNADELVDPSQTDEFAARLRKAGVAVDLLHVEGKTHFAVVADLANPDDPVAKAIVAFVERE